MTWLFAYGVLDLMGKPIKLTFTVEFEVLPDEGVMKVLTRMRVIRAALARLGFARVSSPKMSMPAASPDGLVVALTETLQ